jgi:putative (di)nucleoside polyphosphate hydrolase
VIDAEGYRANVGIVLINKRGKVFWGKRIRQRSWQFPQGGVNEGESTLAAMYRELYEEVGLKPLDVEIITATRSWLKYRLPAHMIRRSDVTCVGQKQKWFLLRLLSEDSAICFNCSDDPEFDHWRWVDYWYPLSQVIAFKRHVYRRALETFFPIVKAIQQKSPK